MLTEHALFMTPEASRQLNRLCRHFSHKSQVWWTELEGEVRFAVGVCRMQASPKGLTLHCEAETAADLAQLQEILRIHLQRFAELEQLELNWTA